MVNEVLELVEEFVKEHPYACIIAGTGLVVGGQFMYYKMLNDSIKDAMITVAIEKKKKAKKDKKAKKETED
jgi:hypothetical protein